MNKRQRRDAPKPTSSAAILPTSVVLLLPAALGVAVLCAQPARVVAAQPAARSRTINLSFYDADAADVLRTVSLQSGVNIALTPSVRGRVITVRVRQVTVEEALRIVTEAAGVSFRRIGGTYVVGTPDELKRAGATNAATSATYASLKNVAPATAKQLIEGALPSVSVRIAEGVQAVILSGPAPDVLQAQRLLAATDVATPAPPPSAVVVTPTNVSAEFLADVLRRAVPDATFEVRTNTLIVSGAREAVARAGALVPAVDVRAGAGRRVEVYTVRYSSAPSLAAMLAGAVPGVVATPSAEAFAPPPANFQPLTGGSLGGGSLGGIGAPSAGSSGLGAGGGGTGSSGTALAGGISPSGAPSGGAGGNGFGAPAFKARSLIVAGPEAAVEEALLLLRAVDIAPIQVEIEARIVDISLDNSLNGGVQWGGLQTQGTTGGGTTQQFVPGTSQNQVQEGSVPDIIRFGRFRRTPFNFAAQLQFLETQGRSKTLANPRISVLDNEDANIFIGDILRFQILAFTSATAGNSFTVQEIPVGIALLARPRVNDNNEITLKIKPVISTITRFVGDIPQTASREADTTLRIKDGETIVIGGLIRDQESKSVQEVPLLAKIPILGELFRNRINQRLRSEVLIFLTPRILRDNGAAAAAQALRIVPQPLPLTAPQQKTPTTLKPAPKETPKP